jgi:hypothetical protein
VPSRKVRAKRFRELEKFGFDYVGNLYLKLGGVRKLMNHLFEPVKGGEQVNTGDFYHWLDRGRHRDKWHAVQAQRLKDRFLEQRDESEWIRAMKKIARDEKREQQPLSWSEFK